MLATLADADADARERIAVGLGPALLLWLLGRAAGALVLRRYLKLQRPSFAHVIGRVVVPALSLLGALVAVTVIFPTIKPVDLLGSVFFVSIAVGFAFRDILENLLAGILLLFRAPSRTRCESFVSGRLISPRDARLLQRSPPVLVRSTAVGVVAGLEIG